MDSAIATLHAMDDKAATSAQAEGTADSTTATEKFQPAPGLDDIVTLPNGHMLIKRKMTARDFFAFQRKVAKSARD